MIQKYTVSTNSLSYKIKKLSQRTYLQQYEEISYIYNSMYIFLSFLYYFFYHIEALVLTCKFFGIKRMFEDIKVFKKHCKTNLLIKVVIFYFVIYTSVRTRKNVHPFFI